MWHWDRITTGPLKGAWFHPAFLKHNKFFCMFMSRHTPAEELSFNVDPRPFLPGQKPEPQPRTTIASTTTRALEQSSSQSSIAEPIHSMNCMDWNQAAREYPSSTIMVQKLYASGHGSLLDSLHFPNATPTMSILEPTPILENSKEVLSTGNNSRQTTMLEQQASNPSVVIPCQLSRTDIFSSDSLDDIFH
jgi:hypothetical protein